MKRLMMDELIQWRNKENRKPLILQGVRQCGKTYLLKEFGERFYEDVAYYKFDTDKQIAQVFEKNLYPHRIMEDLSLQREKTIRPGKTLVIFDEAQACYAALTSLKYFQEEAPEYHVIAAGSLLGVAKPQPPYSFPVGKVDMLTLFPMSFKEFLIANGREMLVRRMDEGGDYSGFSAMLKEYLERYYIIGGMPEAVRDWVENKDIERVDEILARILDGYEADVSKHAPRGDFPKISAIWNSIPKQLAKENQKFIFSQVKSSWRAKDLEDALWWLARAGMVYKLELVKTPLMPLKAYADATHFKLFACDVGLMRKLAGVAPAVIMDNTGNYTSFKGSMTENYAFCELKNIYGSIYYWRSDNSAEVDFLVQDEADVVPVEVKSSKAKSAQSLSQYCKKYKPGKSLLTSLEQKSGTLPLYALWTIKNWLKDKGGKTEGDWLT
ncbi:MAG: AAA family ATPase [Clostridiales Family XIII bacterium]|jgi:predicted AAA+ superfamily ATPase|nr:AAA family ATPase [Clostridiales Family XIII bacterium]